MKNMCAELTSNFPLTLSWWQKRVWVHGFYFRVLRQSANSFPPKRTISVFVDFRLATFNYFIQQKKEKIIYVKIHRHTSVDTTFLADIALLTSTLCNHQHAWIRREKKTDIENIDIKIRFFFRKWQPYCYKAFKCPPVNVSSAAKMHFIQSSFIRIEISFATK